MAERDQTQYYAQHSANIIAC